MKGRTLNHTGLKDSIFGIKQFFLKYNAIQSTFNHGFMALNLP